MKKILVTTLALLSLAAVSTMDARISAAAAAANAGNLLGAAKDLTDAKKDKKSVKEESQEVVAELTNPNMTKEQRELVAKRAQRAELEKLIRLKKDEISDIGYGWFGFGTSEEQKSQHRRAKGDLVKLAADLKDVNARIRELETTTGKRWSRAVERGIQALAAVGIIVIAYGVDKYKFEGAGMKYLGEQTSALYEGASTKMQAGRAALSNWWNSANKEANKAQNLANKGDVAGAQQAADNVQKIADEAKAAGAPNANQIQQVADDAQANVDAAAGNVGM